jgi:alkylation response protein AidB-like acyl-CoA dehydrogenase
MGELGWIGLTLPEAYGGVGLDFATLVVLLEETGRSLFPSPLISTVLAAKAIERAGTAEQQARWLPGLVDGSQIGTFALLEESDSLEPEDIALSGVPDGKGFVLSGSKRIVADAAQADLYVVAFRSGTARDAVSLCVVERSLAGVAVEAFPCMDLTKPAGRLALDGVRISESLLLGASEARQVRLAAFGEAAAESWAFVGRSCSMRNGF